MEYQFERLPQDTFERGIYAGGGFARASTSGNRVQHAEYHDAAFLVHSDSLKVDVLADKFFHVRNKHQDLRERAVSLKKMCKELGKQHKFSFIVLDCETRRVFCAATENSAPLSFGHGVDGTLIAFCSRIGNKSHTQWPFVDKNKLPQASAAATGEKERDWNNLTQRHSQDVRGMGAINANAQRRASADPRSNDNASYARNQQHHPSDPLTSRQSIDDANYNWGRESSSIATTNTMDGKFEVPEMSYDPIQVTYMPSGRFVYGHKYLQPFEFTSFWSSSTNNRSGVPESRYDSHEFYEKQRERMEETFVISKSGERKSIDELRAPNDIPRRSTEEARSRNWATTDHASDRLDNWRRKSEPGPRIKSEEQTHKTPPIDGDTKSKTATVDGSVFSGSSFGKISKAFAAATTGKKASEQEPASSTPIAQSEKVVVPRTLTAKSAPFVPVSKQQQKLPETSSSSSSSTAVVIVKRSRSTENLSNVDQKKRGPGSLKKMFAKLFRSKKEVKIDNNNNNSNNNNNNNNNDKNNNSTDTDKNFDEENKENDERAIADSCYDTI